MENTEFQKTGTFKSVLDWLITISGLLSLIIGKIYGSMDSERTGISNEVLSYILYAIGIAAIGYVSYRFIHRLNKMEDYLLQGLKIIHGNKKQILKAEVNSLIPYFENQYRELCKTLSNNPAFAPNGEFAVDMEILKMHVKSEIMKIAKDTTGREIEEIIEIFYKPQEKKEG